MGCGQQVYESFLYKQVNGKETEGKTQNKNNCLTKREWKGRSHSDKCSDSKKHNLVRLNETIF